MSAPFRRDGGRGRSSSPLNRKSTRSPGGRERSLSPWGTKRRSLSRTPRGNRKPGISRDRLRGARPRKGRSPSEVFSSGGIYKLTPRNGNRLDKYKTKDVCHLWQNTRVASMAMPAHLPTLDRLRPQRLHRMMLGTGTAVGMTIPGAPVTMTGVLVTYGTLQMKLLRLLVPTHSKEKVEAKEKERVGRKEKADT